MHIYKINIQNFKLKFFCTDPSKISSLGYIIKQISSFFIELAYVYLRYVKQGVVKIQKVTFCKKT